MKLVMWVKQRKNTTENERPKRNKKGLKTFEDCYDYKAGDNVDEMSYCDIKELSEQAKKLWRQAMEDKMASMQKNKVWESVNFPKNKKKDHIEMVVFRKKGGKYKSKLVIHGFLQKRNVGHCETFTPVFMYYGFKNDISNLVLNDYGFKVQILFS